MPDLVHRASRPTSAVPADAKGEVINEASTLASKRLTFNEIWNDKVRAGAASAPIAVVVLPRSEGAAETCDNFSIGQLDEIAKSLAKSYASVLPPRTAGQAQRVAAFVVADSFELLVNQIAINLLGHAPAFLSHSCTPDAIAHLIQATSASVVFHDAAHGPLVDAAVQLLCGKGLPSPLVASAPDRMELAMFSKMRNGSVGVDLEAVKVYPDDITVILHSSGSTGLPKPIRYSHDSQAKLFTSEHVPAVVVTLPLFHHFGMICTWRAVMSGSRTTLCYGILKTDALLEIMRAAKATWLTAVPHLVKLLSEHDDGVAELARFERVMMGGCACPDEIGDKLVDKGVNLVMMYGASEFGSVANSCRSQETRSDWAYLTLVPPARPYVKFELLEGTEGHDDAVYGLFVRSDWPCMADVKLEDGGFRPNDLFRRHPSRPDAFRVLGRKDDLIGLSNGEKLNPLPTELVIETSPLVNKCIVFGSGHPMTGVLIQPSPSAAAHFALEAADAEAGRAALWQALRPVVEAANQTAPSYGRLVPEMVRILPHGSRIPTTDKGSLLRPRALARFQDEIDRAYDEFEQGKARTSGTKVKIETIGDALAVVANIVKAVLPLPLDDGASRAEFVELGMDSLQALRIRNMLQSAMVDDSPPLPSNVAFDHPTVGKLAAYLLLLARDSHGGGGNDATELEETKALLERFRAAILPLKIRTESKVGTTKRSGHAVVLTGATGSLGAHILYQLSRVPSVSRVVCLVRATSDADARLRIEKSLQVRKLPSLDAMTSARGVVVDALASDLARDGLGLASSAYDELLSTVDIVLHIAWPVNFNMSVGSFSANLQGTVNLMNLASQSRGGRGPGRFLFASSVSTAMGAEPGLVSETVCADPTVAMATGYARSKWIVEQLCSHAKAIGGGFDPVVLRIGQLIGDTVDGVWNQTEAVPLMIRSAREIGCLPDLRGREVCWIAVDTAAHVVTEIATRPQTQDGGASECELVHVVNPCLTPLDDFFAALAKPEALGPSGFTLVPPDEWVRRLEQSAGQDAATNPTLRLLDHYRSLWGTSKMRRRGDEEFRFETKRLLSLLDNGARGGADDASDSAPRAVMFAKVGDDHVAKMVKAWREQGFL